MLLAEFLDDLGSGCWLVADLLAADGAFELLDQFPRNMTREQSDAYWSSVEIPYRTYYAYEELLATFGDAPGSPLTLIRASNASVGEAPSTLMVQV